MTKKYYKYEKVCTSKTVFRKIYILFFLTFTIGLHKTLLVWSRLNLDLVCNLGTEDL